MIVIPASLRSDFIHMAGMTIHIALESTIHIVGIRTLGVADDRLRLGRDLGLGGQLFYALEKRQSTAIPSSRGGENTTALEEIVNTIN